jgi:hypothetical protein
MAGSAYGASREDNLADPIIGEENTVLAVAPNVPPPIHRDHATKAVVHLEVRELEGRLADGVRYTFFTFGGHVRTAQTAGGAVQAARSSAFGFLIVWIASKPSNSGWPR